MASRERDLVTVMAGRSPKVEKYIECSCGCAEHTMRFTWFDEPEEEEMYLYIFLNSPGFFRRLWRGIRYIFGRKTKYGHFDDVLLTYPQIEKLRDLCDGWLDKHPKPPVTPEEELKIARLMVAFREQSLEKSKQKLNEAWAQVHKEELDGKEDEGQDGA
jgi:hypothetical protein